MSDSPTVRIDPTTGNILFNVTERMLEPVWLCKPEDWLKAVMVDENE